MKKIKDFTIPALPKKLTKVSDKSLDLIIKEEVNMLKEHFKEDCWDIDAHLCLDTILSKYFNFDLPYVLYSRIINAIKGTEINYSSGKFLIKNTRDIVFYNPIRNLMYVATTKRNPSSDVILGNL